MSIGSLKTSQPKRLLKDRRTRSSGISTEEPGYEE